MSYIQPPEIIPVQVNVNGHISTRYQVIDRGTVGMYAGFASHPRLLPKHEPVSPHKWTESIL